MTCKRESSPSLAQSMAQGTPERELIVLKHFIASDNGNVSHLVYCASLPSTKIDYVALAWWMSDPVPRDGKEVHHIKSCYLLIRLLYYMVI